MDETNSDRVGQNKRAIFSVLAAELSIVCVLVAIVLVLNYFNIFALSKIYPDMLGFLPHIADSRSPKTSNITVSLDYDIQKNLLEKYMQETLREEFISDKMISLTKDVITDKNIAEYWYDWKVKNNYLRAQIHENPEGKLLDIAIVVITPNVASYSADIATETISSFYTISDTMSEWKMTSVENTQSYWMNSDGTKDVRAISNFKGLENPQGKLILIACRITKEYQPFYDQNTCLKQ